MNSTLPDHYATLGLDRACTTAQVRAAYRALVKKHHPDVQQSLADTQRIRELNAAQETLGDPTRRRAYDRAVSERETPPPRGRIERNISQDVQLRIEELLRGTELEIRVKDPTHAEPECYRLQIPAETAPGARFRIPRSDGGVVNVRARVRPDFRFKVKGADLRCDLRISAQRAAQGGSENVASATGTRVSIKIPARVGRGEVIRVPGEGLPKPRGGRGDLLVRITYRPEVRISRSAGR